jgi:hypothetical protein
MATKHNDNDYSCPICYKHYNRLVLADSCEKTHNTIYVPLQRADINLLIQFLFTDDRSLLPELEGVVKTLMQYTKVKDLEVTDERE